jgi:glycine/D-amino acid oxidase-like deaminating enzyme
VQGALPEYFGRGNWGAESVDDSPEEREGGATWNAGRIKALWTGILGVSADLQPWVGRVPSGISCRAAPPAPALLTIVSDNATVSDRARVALPLAPPGEWISAGYSGEGMVHAWLCAHALALMVLGLEKEEGVHTWFPNEYRLTEKRLNRATIERLMAKF